MLTGEAERAVDGVLAGPLPEAVVHSIVANNVPERVLRELLETAGSDAQLQELVDTLAGHVVRSPVFKEAAVELIRSPEVREALAEQTSGAAGGLVTAVQRRAARADGSAEARVGRWVRRTPKLSSSLFGGLGSRGAALVLDAALAQLLYLLGAASVILVGTLVGASRSGWLATTLAAVGWALVMTIYFVGSWSGAGQTPGMRLLGVRVQDARGNAPSVPRSLLRLVGLVLAIIPLGAGFLPVLFDRDRRGLHDYLAGTRVPYA